MDGVQPAAEASPILRAALWYAAHGWRVFPVHGIRDGRCTCGDGECSSPGKYPHVRGWQRIATAETRQIRQWWAQWPWANVAIVADDRVIIDVDGDAGYSSLDVLEHEHGELPPTPRSRTARGQHIHFAAPVGAKLSISAGALGVGLDVRAGNGYVVAPPSVHASGVTYSWIAGMGPHEIGVAPAPAWLIELLHKDHKDESGDIDFNKLFDGEPEPAETTDATDEDDEDDEDDNEKRAAAERERKRREAYLAAAVDRELAAVAHAPEGTRNDQLNRSSYWLGRYVAAGELNGPTAARSLAAAAERAGLKKKEIAVTIASGMKAGAQDPRRVPAAEPVRSRTNGHARMDDDGDVPPPSDGDAPPEAPKRKRKPVPDGGPLTEIVVSERLVARFGGDLKYCGPLGGWYRWTSTHWERDEREIARERAKDVARDLAREAADSLDPDLFKAAKDAGKASGVAAVLSLARSVPGVSFGADDVDTQPDLFNTLSHTIDLRTFEAREHRREDMLTMVAPVVHDPRASCPTFRRMLAEILPDPELGAFMQRFAGYCLTGDTSEQCLVVPWGDGANGKTTLIEAMRNVLGAYALEAPADTFTISSKGRSADNKMAGLRGVRMVTTSETGEGKRLDETLIKHVTGCEQITANHLYRETFRYMPAFKAWLPTNHKPEVLGVDLGIWRRIRLVPFTVTIPPERQDRELPAKLRAEAPGILQWMLEGCRAWRVNGLQAPAAVIAATDEWKAEANDVASFAADECVAGDFAKCKTGALYAAYRAWAMSQGCEPLKSKAFGLRLAKLGFKPDRTNAEGRVWRGIGLRAQGHDA